MSYATIVAAVLTTIQTHADFDTDNCKADDLSPLAKGKSEVVNVIYSTHGQKDISLGIVEIKWTINVDVYVPFKGRMPDLLTDLATSRQKIIDTLSKYPKLGDAAGVTDATLQIGMTPELLSERKGRYKGQRSRLIVTEISTPVRAG
jgi:hypothetical protein